MRYKKEREEKRQKGLQGYVGTDGNRMRTHNYCANTNSNIISNN